MTFGPFSKSARLVQILQLQYQMHLQQQQHRSHWKLLNSKSQWMKKNNVQFYEPTVWSQPDDQKDDHTYLELMGDSELVVGWMTGRYECREATGTRTMVD